MKRFIRVFGALLTATLLSIMPYSSVLAGATVSGDYDYRSGGYRFYQNQDSLTPGSPLSSINTPATLANQDDDFRLRTGVKSEMGWKQLAGGYEHACGVADDDKVYCWGRNFDGALGIGEADDDYNTSVPKPVDWTGVLAGKTVKKLASGGYYNCVVASDDLPYCCGADWDGALGDNASSFQEARVPVAVDTTGVLAGLTVKDIDIGENITCAIASNDQVYCWGRNNDGELGNGTTMTSPLPVAVDWSGVLVGKTALKIGVGSSHVCILASDHQVYCWGYNGSTRGQLGNNSTATRSLVPVAVDTSGVLFGKTIVDIVAGYGSSCVLDSDDKVYCWGSHGSGQLGDGSPVAWGAHSKVPVAVDTSGVLAGTSVAGLMNQTYSGGANCVYDEVGQIYCWGSQYTGNFSNGTITTQSNVPVLAFTHGDAAGKEAVWLAGLDGTYCMIDTEGQAYCSGGNWAGQLGDGTTVNKESSSTVVSTGPAITSSGASLQLQYTSKNAATCQASTGFMPVTSSSAIAFASNSSLTNGQAISAEADDPITDPLVAYQSYVESGNSFTNPSVIDPATYGLWDFSLTDKSAKSNTTYCLRIAYDDGTPLERYGDLPEITTAEVLAASVIAPTITKVTWQGNKPVVTGTYDARNTSKLEVSINGHTYVLGVSTYFTADGDYWTLDLLGSSDMNDYFENGEYTVTVLGTTTGGDSLSDTATTTVGGSDELANTGLDVTYVIGVSSLLMIVGLIATASTMRNKRMTL